MSLRRTTAGQPAAAPGGIEANQCWQAVHHRRCQIDATAAATGGGFLEFAPANVSDPLMPGMTDAIQSITFSEIPEPASAGLALFAILAWQVASSRHR